MVLPVQGTAYISKSKMKHAHVAMLMYYTTYAGNIPTPRNMYTFFFYFMVGVLTNVQYYVLYRKGAPCLE